MTTGNGNPRGTAGRRGDGIRSDLWVSIEGIDTGGLQLTCRSRVEPYYGEAIRRQVTEVLAALGVAHARVEIEDTGAAPFVIAARLEAAALAAGLCSLDRLAEPRARRDPSSRNRLRRSRLYLPGNEPKYLINAGLYGADAVILDLEDSVHPDSKAAARRLVCHALRTLDFGAAERMVRINQLPLGLEDLEHVLPEEPDLLLLPKIERPEQVREVADAVDRISHAPQHVWLMPILESALGVEHAFAIADASRRVVALTIGLEDYASDLGVPRSADGEESLWARRRLVNAARAAGLQPIDSVYGQVDDLEGLLAWGRRARRQGFVGMGCLHPRQIPVIHEAFAPTAEEVERAQRIVQAAREAERDGRAVVSLGSKMIDPPVVRQAEALVEHARRIGSAAAGGEVDDQD